MRRPFCVGVGTDCHGRPKAGLAMTREGRVRLAGADRVVRPYGDILSLRSQSADWLWRSVSPAC